MGISIGLGIGIPMGYPEGGGGGTPGETFFILSQLGDFIVTNAASDSMITENSP